jgi:hypothetical protein
MSLYVHDTLLVSYLYTLKEIIPYIPLIFLHDYDRSCDPEVLICVPACSSVSGLGLRIPPLSMYIQDQNPANK